MGKQVSDLYKEVAELTGTTPEQVEAVILEFWYGVREEISKSQGNNILIHRLGNFSIPDKMIDKYIEKLDVSFKNGNLSQRRYEKGRANLLKIKGLMEEKTQ